MRTPRAGECHLWPVPVPTGPADERDWLTLLDPADHERADRFQVEHARRTFITSRGAQRAIAACYLGVSPPRAHVDRECRRCGPADHGRPRIRGGGPLDMSVSHAGDWVFAAVVGSGSVGVDLEPDTRATQDLPGLADAVLTLAERAVFDALPGDRPRAWFYWCWTRKEAAAKLTGHGLTVPLRSLDVRGDRLQVADPPEDWPDTPIRLVDAPAPPGYAAALASTAPATRISLFTTFPAAD